MASKKFKKILKKVSSVGKKLAGWVVPSVATLLGGPGAGAFASTALAGYAGKRAGPKAALNVLGQGIGATAVTSWATGAIDRAITSAGEAAAAANETSGAPLASPGAPVGTNASWRGLSTQRGGIGLWIGLIIAFILALIIFIVKPWKHLKLAAA